jgi:hypothetical protein
MGKGMRGGLGSIDGLDLALSVEKGWCECRW